MQNLPSAHERPAVIRKFLLSEIADGDALSARAARTARIGLACGPLLSLSAVPKGHDSPPTKYGIIFNLSSGGRFSVNDRIPEELGATAYPSFSLVLRTFADLCEREDAPHPHLALFDVSAAFRLLPINPSEYQYLVMRFDDMYFVDTRLPFGVRTGPALYNTFGAAVQLVLEASGIQLVRMLDDHAIYARSYDECASRLDAALRVALTRHSDSKRQDHLSHAPASVPRLSLVRPLAIGWLDAAALGAHRPSHELLSLGPHDHR